MFRKLLKCSISAERSFHNKVQFTKNNYNVKRGNYSHLEDDHIYTFMDIVGDKQVVMDLCDLEKYNVDWLKCLRGASRIVLKPKTTEQVSEILAFCNNNRLAVCPQGGNTGLVGGSVPVFDEIIISSENMHQIEFLDEISGVLKCQSGCILQTLDDCLKEKGLIFPLDLGAKGSCTIGGNVATNAGGLRLIKYGNLHSNIVGLEIVKANGEILDCMSVLKKDNTGYHLKNLFLGSEGTLGFITKVAVQCPPRPKAINLAFLGCQNFDKVLKTFYESKQDLGEILSAYEVMDSATMELINQHLNMQSPIGNYPFYVLLETCGSDEEHDREKVERFLERCLLKHFILNGLTTPELSKINAIWAMRENIPETFQYEGYVFIYDISLPLDCYYTIVADMKKHMGSLSHRVFGFGHLGDSNLHLQISVKEFSSSLKDYIEPYIFKKVRQLNGSISAEHGMGFLKAKYLSLMRSPTAIGTMRSLKRTMDPNGILNPYKVLV